jgi:hypothetical protein
MALVGPPGPPWNRQPARVRGWQDRRPGWDSW